MPLPPADARASLRADWLVDPRANLLAGLVTALALIPEVISFSIVAGVDAGPHSRDAASLAQALATACSAGLLLVATYQDPLLPFYVYAVSLILAGGIGIAGIGAALLLGAVSLLVSAEAVVLSSAAGLKIQGSRGHVSAR